MATLVETAIAVEVRLATDAQGGKHAFLRAQSFDAQGNQLRVLPEVEVTGALTQQQATEALDLVTAANDYVKALWSIP